MGGIVAGRLVERLGAAVAVVAVNEGHGVGSVRAPRGVKVYDAVRACADVLEGFGGHDAAAGLRVRASRVEALRAAFANAVSSTGRVAEVEAPRAEVMLREEDLTPRSRRTSSRSSPRARATPSPSSR
ncbi:MAG: DHHA1 domain-containing protein [Polyangiales bacterium]